VRHESVRAEAEEVGPEPLDTAKRAIWHEERLGAVELMAALAQWDRALLQRAALEVADEWSNAEVRQLLIDASNVGAG